MPPMSFVPHLQERPVAFASGQTERASFHFCKCPILAELELFRDIDAARAGGCHHVTGLDIRPAHIGLMVTRDFGAVCQYWLAVSPACSRTRAIAPRLPM